MTENKEIRACVLKLRSIDRRVCCINDNAFKMIVNDKIRVRPFNWGALKKLEIRGAEKNRII